MTPDPLGDAIRHERRQRHAAGVLEDMVHLAESFPSLQGAPGTAPFEPETLAEYARSGAMGSGAFNAALFVLYVWNPRTSWGMDGFDLATAWGSWDYEHRAAFQAWARNPWFA